MPPNDVARWRSVLQSGKLPSGRELTPAQKIALQKRIEEYEATAPPAPEAVAAVQQEMAPYEEQFGPPAAPPEVTLSPRQAVESELGPAPKQSGIARIVQQELEDTPSIPLQSSPLGMSSRPNEVQVEPGPTLLGAEERAPVFSAWNEELGRMAPQTTPNRNESLKNLSKDTRLDTPHLFAGAPDESGNAPSRINTVFHLEPSVDYVRDAFRTSKHLAERAGISGEHFEERLKGLSKDSDAYKVAADIIYRDAFTRARQQNRPIVRMSQFGEDGGVQERVIATLLNNFSIPVSQLASNLIDSATLGWGLRTSGEIAEGLGAPEGFSEEMQDVADQAPTELRVAGQVGGALMPGSGPSRLFSAVSKRLGTGVVSGAQEGASWAGSALRSGLAGGLTAAGDSTSREMAEQFLGEREKAATESLRNVINSTMVGFGLGVGGEILGRGASAFVRHKQKADPVLSRFESAGGEYKLTGVKMADELEAKIDEVIDARQARDAGKPEALSGYVDELVEPIARTGQQLREGVIKTTGEAKEAFYGSPSGGRPRDTRVIWEWLEKQVQEARGGKLTGREKGGQAPQYLIDELGKFSTFRPANPARDGGARVMRLDEARALFGTKVLRDAMAELKRWHKPYKFLSDEAAGSDLIAIRPRPHTAREIDNAVSAFKDKVTAAKQGGSSTQGKLWHEMAATVRKMRDSDETWREIHKTAAADFRRANDTLYNAGLTNFRGSLDDYLEAGKPGYSVLAAEDVARARNVLAGYGDAASVEASNRALEFLAHNADVYKKLTGLKQLREGVALRERGRGGGSPHVSATQKGPYITGGSSFMQWMSDRAYGPAKVIGSTPLSRSIDFDGLKNIPLDKLPKKVLAWLGSQRGQRVDLDEVTRSAFGLRGGGPARIAGSEDLANLQTLIDVAWILEGTKANEPGRSVSSQ